MPGGGVDLGVNSQEVVPGQLAAPALRRSPRDHAARLVRGVRESSRRAAREIGARGSVTTVSSRPVHTNAISRVSAWNAFGPGLTVRLLSRCEPGGGSASRWRR